MFSLQTFSGELLLNVVFMFFSFALHFSFFFIFFGASTSDKVNKILILMLENGSVQVEVDKKPS